MNLFWMISTWFMIKVSASEIASLVPLIDITLPQASEGLCKENADRLREGIENHKLWAMQMWDATAQGATGALFGNNWHLGSFDECLTVDGPISSQYCLLVVNANISRNYQEGDFVEYIQETIDDRRWLNRAISHLGLCLPQQCSTEEIMSAVSAQIQQDYNGTAVSYEISAPPEMCTKTLERASWSANEICFMVMIAMFLLTALAGSFLPDKNQHPILQALKCSSVPQNLGKLFEVGKTEKSKFHIFHGVKVISMAIIVIGHRGSLPVSGAIANYHEVEKAQQGFNSMLFSHADLVVDSFFFISGVLATHLMCKTWSKRHFSMIQAAISRLTRIAPAYYMIVWFQASVAHRVGSGPIWNLVQKSETEACQSTWWANLAFINNYVPPNQLCHLHSWYLGCDMQFFLLTLLLTPLLVKHPSVGKWLLGSMILVTSIFPTIAVVLVPSLEPILIYFEGFHSRPRESMHLMYLYNPGHMRVNVYLIGMATGFFLWIKEDSKYQLTTVKTFLAAFIGLAVLWTPMALGGDYYTAKELPGLMHRAFYATLRRPTFTIGLVILLLTHRFTAKDYFSFFTSNQIILVLSRLTFTIYLVHFPYILYDWAQIRTSSTYSLYYMVTQGLSDMMLCAVYAALIHITIELPTKRIFQEVVFSRKPPPVVQTIHPEVVVVNGK